MTATLHPIWTEAGQQALFRRLLTAMSHPGRVIDCGDCFADAPPTLAVLACLLDHASSLADPTGLLEPSDHRMLDVTTVEAEQADWLLLPAAIAPAPDLLPRCGTIHQPEASCTVVLDGLCFDDGLQLSCRGPGINGSQDLRLGGLDPSWLALRQRCCARQPMGFDLICCAADAVVCLPRTTHIKEN